MTVHNINPVSKTLKTPYQIKRDELISHAEIYADLRSKRNTWAWAQIFLDEMDYLAREYGIINPDIIEKYKLRCQSA